MTEHLYRYSRDSRITQSSQLHINAAHADGVNSLGKLGEYYGNGEFEIDVSDLDSPNTILVFGGSGDTASTAESDLVDLFPSLEKFTSTRDSVFANARSTVRPPARNRVKSRSGGVDGSDVSTDGSRTANDQTTSDRVARLSECDWDECPADSDESDSDSDTDMIGVATGEKMAGDDVSEFAQRGDDEFDITQFSTVGDEE